MYSRLRERFLKIVRFSPFPVQKIVHSFITKRAYARWLRSGKPLPPPRIVKQNHITRSRETTGCRILVETGTYLGDMIFFQLKNFKRLYSIELDEQLYRDARRRFKNCPHVTIIQGDSAEKLQSVVDQVEEPAVFWLDGHYSGGITALGNKVTPIFEELKIIFSKKMRHVILIDDARLFNGTDGYPSLEDLRNFIFQYYPGQHIEVNDDCIQFILEN